MKRFAWPVGVFVVAAAFLFWWFSPVQVVKRRTGRLLETLTLEPNTGRSGRQMGVYSLQAMLAREVEIQASGLEQANGTFDRSEMETAFSWLCEQARQSRFEVAEFHRVKLAGDQADVAATVDALVELPGYRPADGRHQAEFRWRREEDGWRLIRIVWSDSKP
jgi:hypothetical protein